MAVANCITAVLTILIRPKSKNHKVKNAAPPAPLPTHRHRIAPTRMLTNSLHGVGRM